MRPAQRILVLLAAAITLVLMLPQTLAPPHDLGTVTDHVGRSVPVPPRINKVYATTQAGSLLVYALNPELLLGWNVSLSPSLEFILGSPARELPVLGTWDQVYKTIHLDLIAALQPDIVVHVATPDLPTLELVQQVEEELGIPTVVVDGSLEAIPLTLRFLGELVGRTVRADVLALYAQNILAGLETMRAGLPAERRTVHIVGDAGRVDLPDPLRLAGIGEVNSYNQQPADMILIIPDPIVDLRRELAKQPPPQAVSALSAGRVYEIPTVPINWLTPGSLFRLLCAEWLAQTAYPDLYSVNLAWRLQEFMEVFYEVQLSEKVAQTILRGP